MPRGYCPRGAFLVALLQVFLGVAIIIMPAPLAVALRFIFAFWVFYEGLNMMLDSFNYKSATESSSSPAAHHKAAYATTPSTWLNNCAHPRLPSPSSVAHSLSAWLLLPERGRHATVAKNKVTASVATRIKMENTKKLRTKHKAFEQNLIANFWFLLGCSLHPRAPTVSSSPAHVCRR